MLSKLDVYHKRKATKPFKVSYFGFQKKKRCNVVTISVWFFTLTVSEGRDLTQIPIVHEIMRIIWFVAFFVIL